MLAPEDLNAEWFTAVLQRRYPGVCVTEAVVTRAHEWTNVHAHVTLAYASTSTPAPERVFVKLPLPTRQRRERWAPAEWVPRKRFSIPTSRR